MRTGRLFSIPRTAGARLGLGAALLTFAGVAVAFAAGSKLVMNGSVVSSDVRTIDGQAYVRLSDVAKAMGMTVVARADGFELRKAGGANQVEGTVTGKVGDTLFDGNWRFQVLKLEKPATYVMANKTTLDFAVYNAIAEYDNDKREFKPKPARALVAVSCRAINGKKQSQALWLPNSDTHTALADQQGESHPPIAYDIEESGPFQSKALLPGARTEFTVLFSVPEGTQLKDLVFTLRTIGDKGHDVRVALGEAKE